MSDYHFKDYDSSINEVEFSAIFLDETEKAIKVDLGEFDQWIPKSVCRMNKKEPNENESIKIYIDEWFVIKEDLL